MKDKEIEKAKTYMGRKVAERIEFSDKGTWRALRSAESYVSKLGYEYGSLCYPMPLAFMMDRYNLPEKWKNMTAKERNNVDGVIIGDYREGPVSVIIFNKSSILNIKEEIK